MWGIRSLRLSTAGGGSNNNQLLLGTALGPTKDLTITIKLMVEPNLEDGTLDSNSGIIFAQPQRNTLANEAFLIRRSGDFFKVYLGGNNRTITSSEPIQLNRLYELKLVLTGMNDVEPARLGTAELFVDGVSQGTETPHSHAFFNDNFKHICAINQYEAFGGVLYELSVVGDTYEYFLSGNASDRTDTGMQPVLVDTISGNDAIGEKFATDGSVWTQNITTPQVFLGDQTYGETISGTYTNFGGVPAASNNVVITDGTRSVTVPVTVTDNADGTGSFTGTMPSLPAAGASLAADSLVFPGNVTVTFTDPGQ